MFPCKYKVISIYTTIKVLIPHTKKTYNIKEAVVLYEKSAGEMECPGYLIAMFGIEHFKLMIT